MNEEKKTGLTELVDAAVAFREAERALHLKLEDAAAQLVQWAHGISIPAIRRQHGDAAASVTKETVLFVMDMMRPEIIALASLRENQPGGVVPPSPERDEDPPLFIGGTVSPIRDEGPPEEPIVAARNHLFRAHFDGPGDGDELREDVVGAFEAYHRELWASLARKGML